MTRQEARDVLLLYRPGRADPDDDAFEGALEIVRQDPELAAWFQQHCEVQKTLAAAFQQIPIPEGLKEQILSERKAHFWTARRRVALAVCSGTVTLAALWITFSPYFPRQHSDHRFSAFRERMSGDVQRLYPGMDLETNSLPAIANYLANHKGHQNIALPEPLANSSLIGCAILNWHGKPVSMICFNSGKKTPATSPDLFLFVVNRADFPSTPENEKPELQIVRGLTTATWKTADKVYVLGGFGDEAFLKKYL